MSPGSYLLSWLRAFVLTQIVEMGIYVQASPPSRPLRERLAIAFGASGITHPLVWFVIVDAMSLVVQTSDDRAGRWIGIAVAEAFAFLAEALWLGLFGVRPSHALGWSLAANGVSFLIGLFLYRCMAW